jgi:hypothetical protein
MMSARATSEDMETLASANRKRSFTLAVPTMAKQSKSTEALNIEPNAEYNVPTGNGFAVLGGATQDSLQSSSQIEPNQPKKERIPTITIKWKLQMVQSELQRANFKSDEYQIKLTSIGAVVKFFAVKNYQSFLKRCVDHQVPYFTHALDSMKPIRFVLLGLPNLPTDVIAAELADHRIIPDVIKGMSIRNARYEDHTNYVLHFQKGKVTINQLRQIRAINSVIVKWVYYDSKRHGPTQCRRCQMWGHGSSNCQLSPKCVKCAGDHSTTDCPASKKGEKVPADILKCVNCNQPHSANFGGCERKKQYLLTRPMKKPTSSRRQRSQRTQPEFNLQNFPQLQHQQQQQHFSRSNVNMSYRDRLLGNSHLNKNNPSQLFSSQSTSFKSQMSQNFENHSNLENVPLTPQEAMSFMTDIIPIINSGKPRSEQLMLLFNVTYKYLNGSP